MSILPLCLAIAIQSSNIGSFWHLPSWCPTSTSSKQTIGSDDFVREDNYELKASNAAAFYGVLDGYEQRQYIFGGSPTEHTVTGRGLLNYGNFQSVASGVRTFPICGEASLLEDGIFCGGRSLDAYVDAYGSGTFQTFDWCGNPYEDAGANCGWFAVWGSCSSGDYFNGSSLCGGIAWYKVFDEINVGDSVGNHDYWNDCLLGYNGNTPTVDEVVSNRFTRFVPANVTLASSKVLDLRPIETVAQAIAVHDKAYHVLGKGDVYCSPSNRITSGRVRWSGSGTTTIVTLHGSQTSSPYLEVTSESPLDCGSPTKTTTLTTTYDDDGTSAPRIRGGKVTVSGSVGASCQIGGGSISVDDFSHLVDYDLSLAGYTPSAVGDLGIVTTFNAGEFNYHITNFNVYGSMSCGTSITASDGALNMTTHGSLSASYVVKDTLSQYGDNLPHVQNFTPAVTHEKKYVSIANCAVSGGERTPNWDVAVNFDNSSYTRTYDDVQYRGESYDNATFASVRQEDDEALSDKALEGMEDVCGSTDAFTDPDSYTGISSGDYASMVNAFTTYSAGIEYPPSGTGTGIIRRVSAPDALDGYRWELVSGTLTLGCSIIAKLDATGTLPTSITEGLPVNCAIDCNRVWIEDCDLYFPALSDSSGGSLSTNALCFTHGEVTSNRVANAFVGCRGFHGCDGNDPVYDVKWGGFYNAFSQCPDIRYARFTACTNVDDYAFYSAFRDCPSLYDLDFKELVSAGSHSFEEVTRNCPCARRYDFKKLETCGGSAFRRAFLYADAEEVPFSKLRYCGTNAFEEAWFCGATNLNGVSFPELVRCESNAFKKAFAGYDEPKELKLKNIRMDELEYAGDCAFYEAFAYENPNYDPKITAHDGVAWTEGDVSSGLTSSRVVVFGREAFLKGGTWKMYFTKNGVNRGAKTCTMTYGTESEHECDFRAVATLGSSSDGLTALLDDGWKIAVEGTNGVALVCNSAQQTYISMTNIAYTLTSPVSGGQFISKIDYTVQYQGPYSASKSHALLSNPVGTISLQGYGCLMTQTGGLLTYTWYNILNSGETVTRNIGDVSYNRTFTNRSWMFVPERLGDHYTCRAKLGCTLSTAFGGSVSVSDEKVVIQ